MITVLSNQRRYVTLALAALFLGLVSVACGSADDSLTRSESGFGIAPGAQGADGAAGLPGAPGPAAVATAAPAATPAPRPPANASADEATSGGNTALEQVPSRDGDLGLTGKTGEGAPRQDSLRLDLQVAQAAAERIIIRTVDTTIEVREVDSAIDQIGQLAAGLGGWVVSSQQTQVHRGRIDIRVPADRLDEALRAVRGIASDVKSEVTTSQDFTEEHTDLNARIGTLELTLDSLRTIFDRAEKVEDALEIQREITRVQSDLESFQARVNFLQQSSAFSLLRISVEAEPLIMDVDSGGDIVAAVNGPARFRVEFTPPADIDEFFIEWDFGDGSSPQVVRRVAPVNTEGRVISAPLTHVYRDDLDSPYIVTVKVTGTGEGGVAEGEEVKVVTVTRIPAIEVFPGSNQIVEQGETVEFRGSFTRPEGLDNLTYTWDFGDGSAPVTVEAESGLTRAVVEHVFENFRPQRYIVTLTVEGESAAGPGEASGSVSVLVLEAPGISGGDFNAGSTGKSAMRALSAVGIGVGNSLIWLIVLSPIWLVVGGIAFVIRKRGEPQRKARRAARAIEQATRPPAGQDE